MERTELELQVQEPQVFPSPATGQPWLASRLLHRQVVNAATLEPLGRVTDIVFDPKRCRLAALRIRMAPSESGLRATVRRVLRRRRAVASIGIEHIVSLNGDVVIADIDPARPAPSSAGRTFRLTEVCDLTIITLHGLCLGSLTDLLLEDRGGVVAGYVIRPTKEAEPLLPPFEGPEPPAPRSADTEAGAAEAPPPIEPPVINLRVIPASPRVRIGESLILVVEDVEPLLPEPVVITGQLGAEFREPA